jgi:hypothetical protein
MDDTNTGAANQLETPEDAGRGEAGEVARWQMEIDLSSKVEKKWRDKANKAIDRYRDEGERTDWKFNIYWANVETIRPVLYNTMPRLDVRRRFKDSDPVGRVAAEIIERALEYSINSYDFDEEIDNIILDYLIPSRGVARVRFEPTIEKKPLPDSSLDADIPDVDAGIDDVTESPDQTYEEMTYARCYIEHVAWDRFRRGPGITWKEVPWVAYEHQLTHDEVEKQFPGFGSKVDYDIVMEGVEKERADKNPSVFKRVRIWEIWDKTGKKVRFLAPSVTDQFLKVEQDKLNLEGFFDCERPLYAVKTSTSLVPQVEYEMYKDQAKELDRVTGRIAKLVTTLKQRGIYDSTITEFKELLKAADNEMIPTSTSAPAMQMGGLDKAVWMLPIADAAAVLKQLLDYREQVKQTIYEITGMSDILRGATEPDETLGAQKLKAQTGSRRIQRRQRDVQRFIRGLLRKKAEIIADNYTPQLLSLMTGIQLPSEMDKQQLQSQLAPHPPLQGQPPVAPPQPTPEQQKLLDSPTWEDVMGVIKNDLIRSFRVDIETDSTIAADQEGDREQVTEMIKGIGGFVESVGPAVENGALSIDTAKKILLSAVRRFKFGREVEDAIDQDTGQPQQQKPDPEMAKVQAQMQLEQQKLANAKELEQFRAENDAKVAVATQQAQAMQDAEQQRTESARKDRAMELEHEAKTKQMLLAHQLEMEKIHMQSGAKLQEIRADADVDSQARAQEQRHDLLNTGVNFVADLAKAEHGASIQPKGNL